MPIGGGVLMGVDSKNFSWCGCRKGNKVGLSLADRWCFRVLSFPLPFLGMMKQTYGAEKNDY